MSNIFGSSGHIDQTRSLPQGDVIGSYTSYLDAQKAVDYLADQQFPVEVVAIVGNDLKLVERVTGRLSYPRVALNSALSGMWFGLFVGVLLSFFSSGAGYFSIITSVLMGAAFFMLFGIVTYAMQRGKRDFTSTSQVVPTSYDVVVAFEAAAEARRLLHQLPMGQSQQGWGGHQPWQHHGDQGPHYGEPGQHQGHQDWGQQQGQWQDPNQQGSNQQGPNQQSPQRPSGWSDPYGVNSPQQSGQEPPVEQQEPVEPPRSGSGYRDLPDGRPQYGVRIDTDRPQGREHQSTEPQSQEPQSQEPRHVESEGGSESGDRKDDDAPER
ncbi:general stress protein [Sinomonas terrae]|uniref:ECF transporter S component n=1 Tax=Sinomonas terrae TaxID=2908838 RepID=A0ABS9TYX0_9MICC|nr:general stress protein [Sinomonas terrae]MCH6469545.1 ECF transporter S component [Sinomonas terrae]